MPFDGNPAKFVKPEVFSLEGLVAWLETQDPATEYCYLDTGRCLAAQFNLLHGRKYAVAFPPLALHDFFGGTRDDAPACSFDKQLEAIAAWGQGKTLGAALSRARQLLATA